MEEPLATSRHCLGAGNLAREAAKGGARCLLFEDRLQPSAAPPGERESAPGDGNACCAD